MRFRIDLKTIVSLVVVTFVMCNPLCTSAQEDSKDIGRYAPKFCDFFIGWTGELKPDLSGSSTERWMAQPEIMDLIDELKKMSEGLATNADYEDAFETKLGAELPWIALRQPWAIYIEAFTPDDMSPCFILNLGDKEEWMKELLVEFEDKEDGDVETIEVGDYQGKSYQSKGGSVSEFGIIDGHLLVGTGKGSLKKVLANLQDKKSPKWFAAAKKELSLERLAGLFRVDLANVILEATKTQETLNPELHLEEMEEIVGVVGIENGEMVTKAALHCPQNIQGDLLATMDVPTLKLSDIDGVPESVNALFVGQMKLPKLWKFFSVTNEDTQDAAIKFSTDMLTQYGIDFEKDVVNGFDGFMLSYQKISLLNPAGSGVAYLRVNDADAFGKKLKEVVEQINSESEDFVIEENENKSGIVYSVQPVEQAFGGSPSFHFSLVGDHMYIAADPKAISSHLRKAKRKTGMLTGNERFQSLFDNEKNGGLGEPIAAHYLDLASVLELAYGVVPMLASGPLADAGFDINALPPVDVVTNGLDPNVMAFYRTDKGFLMVERGTLPGITSTMPVMVGMLLPAIQQVRSAARRAVSTNNVRQLILSCHNFESSQRRLPSAYTKNDEGEKLLSWRVHILPYLEENELYEKFHLDEPWDSPHNKPLADQMPEAFKHPSLNLEENETVYLGVMGKQGVFGIPVKPATKMNGRNTFGSVTDGTSNTIMIVEANAENAVVWSKPDDFDFAEVDDIKEALAGNWPGDIVIAGFADGSCSALVGKSSEDLNEMMTINGGEEVQR